MKTIRTIQITREQAGTIRYALQRSTEKLYRRIRKLKSKDLYDHDLEDLEMIQILTEDRADMMQLKKFISQFAF